MGAASDVPSAGRAPLLAVAGIVAAAFAVYGLLAASVGSPHVFTDELLYFDAAAALAEGDGLSVRGEDYVYGRVYPALPAPLQRLAGDRESAYALAKALNALVVALAAVPVFLLARRLLDAWPAVAIAGLAVAIPSTGLRLRRHDGGARVLRLLVGLLHRDAGDGAADWRPPARGARDDRARHRGTDAVRAALRRLSALRWSS